MKTCIQCKGNFSEDEFYTKTLSSKGQPIKFGRYKKCYNFNNKERNQERIRPQKESYTIAGFICF